MFSLSINFSGLKELFCRPCPSCLLLVVRVATNEIVALTQFSKKFLKPKEEWKHLRPPLLQPHPPSNPPSPSLSLTLLRLNFVWWSDQKSPSPVGEYFPRLDHLAGLSLTTQVCNRHNIHKILVSVTDSTI